MSHATTLPFAHAFVRSINLNIFFLKKCRKSCKWCRFHRCVSEAGLQVELVLSAPERRQLEMKKTQNRLARHDSFLINISSDLTALNFLNARSAPCASASSSFASASSPSSSTASFSSSSCRGDGDGDGEEDSGGDSEEAATEAGCGGGGGGILVPRAGGGDGMQITSGKYGQKNCKKKKASLISG